MKRLFSVVLLLMLAGDVVAQDSSYARRIIRDLTSREMYGRGMQRGGDSIAAEYLRSEMQRIGLLPLCKGYFQYFYFPTTTHRPPLVKAGYRSQNVCGYLPGEVDTMVVFTAHYDHLGMHGDTIYYGAHDNASGTAAVLDLARMMASVGDGGVTGGRHYTYVFLLFGGEEAGLVGSAFFADVPLISLNKVKLLVNIDLFCGGDEGLRGRRRMSICCRLLMRRGDGRRRLVAVAMLQIATIIISRVCVRRFLFILWVVRMVGIIVRRIRARAVGWVIMSRL